MENPFEHLNQPNKEVPKELKSKVMKDIAMAKFLNGLVTQFSYNVGNLIDSVIKTKK